MSRLWTVVLLLLVAAAAVFLFVIEPRWTSTREQLATQDFVLNFDPSRVDGVRIVSGDSVLEIHRRGTGWWLGPQPKDRVAPQKVHQILEAGANLRVTDVIRAHELNRNLDLATFGLAESKNEIDFLGDADGSVIFGREAAGDGLVYARRSDGDAVYIVKDDLQRLAFVNPQDLRDRRLTDLGPSNIDKFVLKLGTGEIAVERSPTGWRLVKPLHARADARKVEAYLTPLLGTTILEFVAEDSDDLSAFGLAEPRAELILYPADASRPQALRFGNAAKLADGSDALLVQFTDRDSVYHLPARTWDELQITPDALRDRHLLALNLDTIDRLRIRDGEAETKLARTEDAWQAEKRTDAPPIAEDRIAGLVDGLVALEVENYLSFDATAEADAGLTSPRGEIAFDAYLSENTPEAIAGRLPITKITVGRITNGKAWVRVDDDPEVCVVPAAPVEALLDLAHSKG